MSAFEFAVVPLPAGGWAVTQRPEGASLSVHSCQALAQVEALRLARECDGCVVVLSLAA
jgi:hypothetical protein